MPKEIQDKNAIQDLNQDTDVLDDQDKEDEDIDPRTEAVESIVDNIDQNRKEEMGLESDAELDPEATAKEDKTEAELEAEAKAEAEAKIKADETEKKAKEPEKEPDKPDPDEEMVKVVVDGKESEVPISKIIDAGKRTFQKESAADERLSESKQLLKEVKELKAGIVKPAEPAKEPLKEEEDVTGSMSDQELLEAIRYGEDDDALKAIQALRARSETVKPDDIGKVIDERLIQKEQNAILERFNQPLKEGGFSDLAENPIHMNFTKLRVDELVENGQGSYSNWETYQKAGDWVRETILGQKPSGDDEIVDDPDDPKNKLENLDKSALDQKLDKKRKLTAITPASKTIETDKTKIDDDATLEEGRKNAFKEIRKQREGGRA